MIPLVYENDEIFIIDKPAGLAVQGGQGIVHSVDRDFAEQTGQKVFLVHRLDKDTSGLMIVAKNPPAAGKWTKIIGSKIARKEWIFNARRKLEIFSVNFKVCFWMSTYWA